MNKKMNLGLGSIAAVALPVSAVVSCDLFGSKEKKENKDKDGTISLVSSAKLENLTINGSNGAFDVTLPKGKTITTDKVKALFKGVGTLTVTNDDNFDGNKAGEYKFTIKDSGKGKKAKESIATLTIKIEASWDRELPAVSIYASKANQGQFTIDITKGDGYVAGVAGTTNTIPANPKSGNTVKIDGTVHKYTSNSYKFWGGGEYGPSSNTPWNILNNFDLSGWEKTVKINSQEMTNIAQGARTSNFPFLQNQFKVYAKDKDSANMLGSYANPLISYTKSDEKTDISSELSSHNSAGDIYLYDNHSFNAWVKISITQKSKPTWAPALPPSSTSLYESKANKTEYTTDETKASGYVAKKDPKVKTTNDLVKAAQNNSNKQIIIDGVTYTLS